MSERYIVDLRPVNPEAKRPAPFVVRDGEHPRQVVVAGPFRTKAAADATAASMNMRSAR